jgi:putative SOS response-associated peptidase YedK
MTFNATTGTFTGTPNSTTDFNVKVIASDGALSVNDTFLIGIAPVVNSVAITSATGIQNSTLNAKIETLHEKPSFQAVVNQRCLVPVTGFYEWHWLDSKGKHKEKYLITCAASEIFSFAGLWSTWIDPNTGVTQQSFTILTTAANELMAAVHNSAKRMPIIITPTAEEEWLLGTHAPNIEQRLIATNLAAQQRLF